MPAPLSFSLSPLAAAGLSTGALVAGLVIGSAFRSTPGPAPVRPPPPVALVAAPSPAAVPFAAGSSPQRADSSSGGLAELRAAKLGMSEFARERNGIMATSRLSLAEIPQALAFAETLGSEERKMVTMGALARWAELDPRAAADWTRQQMRRRPELAQMLGTEVTEWTSQDPQAARAWVDSLKSPEERSKALGGYFRALGANDPAQGLQELAGLSAADQTNVRDSFYRAWASRDPQAAVRQAEASGDPATRNSLLKAIMPVWAQGNPQEALTAAMAMDREYAKQPGGGAALTVSLMNDWAHRDPTAALAQLVALPEDVRENVAPGVFGTAAQADPDLARVFAAQLPPGHTADLAQVAIIAGEAQQDAPKAAAAVAALPAGPEQQKAVEAVGMAWARSDPAAAAQWIAQETEGTGRANAARNLVFTWGQRDAQATGQWVATLPPGPSYDAAAGAFAWRAAQTDAPTALEWASSVSDRTQREQTTQMVLEGWLRRDAPAAKLWLQNTSLVNGDLKSYLLHTR